MCYYGAAKVHQQLLEDGFKVSLNMVVAWLESGFSGQTSQHHLAYKKTKKYSYKLRGLDITQANQVWSTDITYVKINGGMAYLAAIIDGHSKAVLSISWTVHWLWMY